MFGKAQLLILLFGKEEILNCNVWKSQKTQFQCLEKTRSSIPMFGNGNVLNSKVRKSTKPKL